MVCEQYLSNTVKSEKKGGRLVQDLLWQVCVTKLRVVLSKCPLPSPASDLGCGTSNRAQNCVSENHSQVVCPVLWIWQWLELFLGPSGADLRASSQQWGDEGEMMQRLLCASPRDASLPALRRRELPLADTASQLRRQWEKGRHS